MGAITESLTYVQGILTGHDVPAAIDPRDLNLPAVWVTIDGYDTDRLNQAAGTISVTLFAIATDSGTPTSLEQLDTLVDGVTTALGGANWESRAVLLVSQGPTPLPALSTTISLDWSK